MMTSRALNETARAMATICWMAVLKVHQRPAHVDLDREAPQQVRRLGVHAPPVEQAVAPVFAAEKDVLRHRAEGDEIDLLIDRADAAALGLLRRGEVDRLAAEFDRARRPAGRRRSGP